MTTRNYSAALAHTNNTTFRAWGKLLSDEMTACGFPKSADTGQVNWLTVARPAYDSASVYEIRYLNDGLHATNPVYLRIEYSTGGTNVPAIYITAGTGTNGAGVISGVMFSRRNIVYGVVPDAGTWPTFMCAVDGFFGFVFSRRGYAAAAGMAYFSVHRVPDTAGDPSADGFLFYYTETDQLFRITYLTEELLDYRSYCFVPGPISTTTLVGGDAQVFVHYVAAPDVRVVPDMLTFLSAEIGAESTFTATPVGVSARTYLALGANNNGSPTGCSLNVVSTHALAMRYE